MYFVMANGDCLELNKQSAKLTQNAVPSGQVFVDGSWRRRCMEILY